MGGLYLLDTVDYYINLTMLFVGFAECFAAGWIFGIGKQAERRGFRSVGSLIFNFNFGVLMATAVGYSIGGRLGGGLAVLFGFGYISLSCTLALLMAERKEGESDAELIWDLFFGNIEELRSTINGVIGHGANWRLPFVWSALVKFFIPAVLIIMICSVFATQNANGKSTFGHYEDLPNGYQVIGILASIFAFFIVFLGVYFPDCYSGFDNKHTVATLEDSKHKDVTLEDSQC